MGWCGLPCRLGSLAIANRKAVTRQNWRFWLIGFSVDESSTDPRLTGRSKITFTPLLSFPFVTFCQTRKIKKEPWGIWRFVGCGGNFAEDPLAEEDQEKFVEPIRLFPHLGLILFLLFSSILFFFFFVFYDEQVFLIQFSAFGVLFYHPISVWNRVEFKYPFFYALNSLLYYPFFAFS